MAASLDQLPLELVTLFAGALIYARAVPAQRRIGDVVFWAFIAALAAVQVYATFGPAPQSPDAQAQTALTGYVVLALLAGLVDWARGTAGTPVDEKPSPFRLNLAR